MDEFGLTLKQRAYVERLIIDFDEKAAANEAGFDYSTIPALRSHPAIKTATEALSKQRIEKLKMSEDEAKAHLKKMAEPVFSDFYEQDSETGKFRVRRDIPEDKMAAIKEIRTASDGTQTIIFHNKEMCIDKVLRSHGSYVNRHRFEGKIDHQHTHQITTQTLIEEMNELLRKRPKVIDAEVVDINGRLLGSNDE